MHHIIYFDAKPLLLTDSKTGFAAGLLNQSGILFKETLDKPAVQEMIQDIQAENTAGGVYVHHDLEELLRIFKKEMKVIKAGGGLVHTDNETVLLIFRRGKWDLPKGKLEKGETITEAAVREVEEETGLKNLVLGEPLTVTYHTYHQKGKLILKESNWFLMKTQEQVLTPQSEEDIELCEWVKTDGLAPYLENAHPSIVDALKLGIGKLHGSKKL